jgi:hypothetical protein
LLQLFVFFTQRLDVFSLRLQSGRRFVQRANRPRARGFQVETQLILLFRRRGGRRLFLQNDFPDVYLRRE